MSRLTPTSCPVCAFHAHPRLPSARVVLSPRRQLSSAAGPTSPSPDSSHTVSSVESTRVLLSQTRDLIRRYPLLEESGEWERRIEAASADLTGPRRAKVAFMGDTQSGVEGLMTSSFDDPLASEGELSLALETRRIGVDHPEALHISYGPEASSTEGSVAIPSNWLKDNQADLVEIVHPESGPRESSLSLGYSADLLVLVLSDLKLLSTPALSKLLLDLSSKPNLLVALSTSSAFSAEASSRSLAIQVQLDSLIAPSAQPPVIPVQIPQALAALSALASAQDSSSSSGFEAFQKGYISSGVPQLRERLAQALKGIKVPADASGVSQLQLQTAQYILDKVISVAANAAAHIDAALTEAEANVAALAQAATEAESEALRELGVKDGKLPVPEEDIKAAVTSLDAMLKERLSWWKLPGRTDDVTSEVADEAQRTFLSEFEDGLIFKTGKLLALNSKLDAASQALFATRAFQNPAESGVNPLASAHSAVLANLVQRAALPFSQAALSHSLLARRAQISSPGGPAELLHSRAQRAVLKASTFTLGSLGGAGWAFVAGLAELPTAVGLGLFGATFGAWRLQRGWEKAKKKFRLDVGKRIKGGLEVDLAAQANALVERMAWQAKTAHRGAEELLEKRRRELDQFRERLVKIDARRRKL